MSLVVTLDHCAAAAASHNHAVAWVRACGGTSQLAYASQTLVYLCTQHAVKLGCNQQDAWRVAETLRSRQARGVITAISTAATSIDNQPLILCAYSTGRIHAWIKEATSWRECLVWDPLASNEAERSITCIQGTLSNDRLVTVTTSAGGAHLITCPLSSLSTSVNDETAPTLQQMNNVTRTLISSIKAATHMGLIVDMQLTSSYSETLVFLGTALPRHNQVLVYQLQDAHAHYVGGLSGHQDWITCGAWSSQDRILATGSHDARIRLWKFTTTSNSTSNQQQQQQQQHDNQHQDNEATDQDYTDYSDNEDDNENENDDDEGESRLTIHHTTSDNACMTTNVTLEALLYGHEDHITSLSWYTRRNKQTVLMSSSMDRSILFWGPTNEQGGIWTPLTRVGSAGGILGGSIGSTLLGYLNASIEPTGGKVLVGHAYGGSIHVWGLNEEKEVADDDNDEMDRWKARPGMTGHFGGVTDMCWEPTSGAYLLTVSQDQTCRLWAPVHDRWIELARPQVHGYDLSAVASLSTPSHPHLLVSGADERELRVFDAPKSTIDMLEAACGFKYDPDPIERTDRAFIPSLGLSNKASAADGAEEDKSGEEEAALIESGSTNTLNLPSERDLGAVSLWPEVGKLFGHTTELYCLSSTLDAQTHYGRTPNVPVILASACKAREPSTATIRLWDVSTAKCIGELAGHKSTVATMSFTPDAHYLVTSGKDRRLCLWKRTDSSYELAWYKDGAHKRIIWSTHVCPFDPVVVASGSRDGCVRIWKIAEDGNQASLQEQCQITPSYRVDNKPDAVTAVSFAPLPLQLPMSKTGCSNTLLAVGLESGRIELWTVSLSNSAPPSLSMLFDWNLCHGATVTKLAWRSAAEQASWEEGLLLASCSSDFACRIFRVALS
jgi:elongator complex protein 2